jgi:2-polyprenyl-6-methoxyphenol hydroxylase-like FAD-dependent oxidoreductase
VPAHDVWDLVVVGGGPAGLATAIVAAERGHSVIVIERRDFPADKACGEGVLPPGVKALTRLGIADRTSSWKPWKTGSHATGCVSRSAPFRHATERFTSPATTSMKAAPKRNPLRAATSPERADPRLCRRASNKTARRF